MCERSDSPRSLGEGAVTCPFTGNLIYIDVTRGKIFIYDPILRREVRCIHLRQTIGTVVPLAANTVVAALVKGICVVNTETGKIEKIICNPEHSIVSNRWNDGKCDPQGRLWVVRAHTLRDSLCQTCLPAASPLLLPRLPSVIIQHTPIDLIHLIHTTFVKTNLISFLLWCERDADSRT